MALGAKGLLALISFAHVILRTDEPPGQYTPRIRHTDKLSLIYSPREWKREEEKRTPERERERGAENKNRVV